MEKSSMKSMEVATMPSEELQGRGSQWSVNGIEEHSGDKECNHSGCREPADWDIYLIDKHARNGLFRTCDGHVEEHYGYHPNRETAQERPSEEDHA